MIDDRLERAYAYFRTNDQIVPRIDRQSHEIAHGIKIQRSTPNQRPCATYGHTLTIPGLSSLLSGSLWRRGIKGLLWKG